MDQHGTTQVSIEAKICGVYYDLEINPVMYYDSYLVPNEWCSKYTASIMAPLLIHSLPIGTNIVVPATVDDSDHHQFLKGSHAL